MLKNLLKNSRTWLMVPAICLATIQSTAQSPGFFLDDWQGKTATVPEYEIVDQPAETPTITVTVDHSQFINKVPQYIYGNNAVTWDNGLPDNPTAMTDLKNLNPHVLRWPGGSLSNSYFWNVPYGQRPDDIPNGISPWYGMNTDWQMSVDEYYELLEETGSTGSICVNYSYARYGTSEDPVATAAHMAAEWVRYDNGRSKYWEIGNENFGNWEEGNIIDTDLNQDGQPAKISGTLYGQHASVFIDSMRAAASEVGTDIKIGVVAYDSENSWDPISEVWNEGMMPIVGDKADFLIVHSYFTPYEQDSPVSTILNSHTVPGTIMAVIEADMAEAGKPMLPVAMTEWNIFAEGSWQQVSYINGMLAAITLGEFVKNNYGMANRWDLVNGWSNGNDHGMFSIGGEPGVDLYNPRAAFFYMYYHQKFFGDTMVNATVTGNDNIVAHASTFSSGETGLVLVNKGNEAETAEIEIENGDPGLQYYYYTLTGGDDNGEFSRKVLINGIETDEQGGGPDEYASIKARSSDTFSGIKVSLPPRSAVYLLVDKKAPLSYVGAVIDTNSRVITVGLNDVVQAAENVQGFEVMLNGSSQVPVGNVVIDPDYPFLVHLYLGQEIGYGDELTLSYSGSDIVDYEGIPLIAFTDQSVENLIPGGPYYITVVTLALGELIQEAEIMLDHTYQVSNAAGVTYFTVMEGQYELGGTKAHYNQVSDTLVEISSDTTLYVELEPNTYSVSLHVTDTESGNNMTDVVVTTVSAFTVTNANGLAKVDLRFGEQPVSFDKFNYFSADSIFMIDSDTTLEVGLTRSHAGTKFRIKNGIVPVVDASVNLNGETLYTGAAGTITFASVPLDQPLVYTIEKENYITLNGSLNVAKDTTVNLQMEKSIANVEFLVSTTSGDLQDGWVVLETDSCAINEVGRCFYYGHAKNMNYYFQVGAPGYETVNDSVYLEQDTTISLLLTPVSAGDFQTGETIMMYPNPSSGAITIQSDASRLESIRVIDITGNTIRIWQAIERSGTARIDLGVPAGIYIVRISAGGKEIIKKLSVTD